MADTNPLHASSWDDSIPVADDFYHHVNAKWLAANPVPPEYPMWGAYIELDHNNKSVDTTATSSPKPSGRPSGSRRRNDTRTRPRAACRSSSSTRL